MTGFRPPGSDEPDDASFPPPPPPPGQWGAAPPPPPPPPPADPWGVAPPPPPPQWGPPTGPPGWSGPAQPPASYQAYGQFAPQQQSLRGLSIAVSVLLGITGLVALAGAGLNSTAASSARAFADDTGSIGDLIDADDAVVGLGGFFSLLLVVTGVLWMIWQYRYASNAEQRSTLGMSKGFAIGGWLIPFAFVAVPQLQLLQSAKGSDPSLPRGQSYKEGRAPTLLFLWWPLFPIGWFVYLVGAGMEPDTSSALGNLRSQIEDELIPSYNTRMVGYLLLAAGAVVSIVLVQQLARRQNEAFATGAAPVPPDPPTWGLGGPPPGDYGGAPPTYGAPPTGPPS